MPALVPQSRGCHGQPVPQPRLDLPFPRKLVLKLAHHDFGGEINPVLAAIDQCGRSGGGDPTAALLGAVLPANDLSLDQLGRNVIHDMGNFGFLDFFQGALERAIAMGLVR